MPNNKYCSCDKIKLQQRVGRFEKLLMKVFPHFDIVKTIKTDHGSEIVVLYLRRFYLFRAKWIGLNFGDLYLHKIARSDDDPDPHDHPWNFRSFILKGGYTDENYEFASYKDGTGYRFRLESQDDKVSAPATRFRARDHIHRVILTDNKPAWTLVVTTGYRFDADGNAEWNFITKHAKVPWRVYLGLTKGEDHGG